MRWPKRASAMRFPGCATRSASAITSWTKPTAMAAPTTSPSSSCSWLAASGGVSGQAGAADDQEDTVPRLILRLDDKIVKRYPLGPIVTVGRLPDNAVVIDSPAVSGHHACLSLDGSTFILEDLDSTNGTFVNDRRITRYTLRNGDVVKIGNHALEFDADHGGRVDGNAAAARIVTNPGDTVFLDADKYQALIAMLKETAGNDESWEAPLAP